MITYILKRNLIYLEHIIFSRKGRKYDGFVNATVSTNIPSSNQVTIFGLYNNGTKDATAGTDRLPGKQVAMYGRYNNRTTTSYILDKYSR